MRLKRTILHFALLIAIATLANVAVAQPKHIILENELTENSKMLKVKMGTQWLGKIWQFKFGGYAVVESKMGFTLGKYRRNLWNTASASESENNFSFVLVNSFADSAIVNCVQNTVIHELHAVNLISTKYLDFEIGNDELLLDRTLFSAFIECSKGEFEDWKVLLDISRGTAVEINDSGILSSNTRRIEIVPTSSNKHGNDTRMLPAMGYEFIEDGHALAAIQYYGGGMLGTNKNRVWLRNDLDPDFKLVLAAAITSIMQLRNQTPY